MFSSLLNETMDIKELSVSQDESGQLINTWATTYSGVRCRCSEAPKNFQTKDDVYKTTKEHFIFFVDSIYGSLVTHQHRISYKGKEYSINKISTFDSVSSAHHTEIYAQIISLEGSSGLQGGVDMSQYVQKTTEINGIPLTSDIDLTPSDIGAAPAVHSHTISQVTGLQGALDAKQDVSSNYDDKSFTFSFSNESSFTVTHNLGKRPSVTVLDTDGIEILGAAIDHVDNNSLTVQFGAAFSGQVICN
jgi:hypothetical protein